MGVINTASFSAALIPGLRKVFGVSYNERGLEYMRIYEKITSQRKFEEEIGFVGLGLPQKVGDGGKTPFDHMEQGFKARYEPDEYRLGFIVTQQMIEDNLYKEISLKRTKALARSFRVAKELRGANVIERATNASYPGADKVSLANIAHPNKSGGTWSNMFAVHMDLSEFAIEQALIQIGDLRDDRGHQIALRGMKLIIPGGMEFDAVRILKSVTQNDTANGATNALRTMGALPDGIVVNHFLAVGSTQWQIQTDCPDGMKYLERIPLDFKSDNDFDTYNLKFGGRERSTFGWTDPRCMWFSPPA